MFREAVWETGGAAVGKDKEVLGGGGGGAVFVPKVTFQRRAAAADSCCGTTAQGHNRPRYSLALLDAGSSSSTRRMNGRMEGYWKNCGGR